MSKTGIRWVKIVGTALSLAILVWLLLKQDWRALAAALGRVSLLALVAAETLYMLKMLLNAWRWHTVSRAIAMSLPWRRAVRLMFAGAFVSNFLPSTVGGDALRMAGSRDATPLVKVAVLSVMLDRLVNVVAMYTFLPFTWLTYGNALPLLTALPEEGKKALGMAGGALVMWKPRLRRHLHEVKMVLGVVARSPRTVASALAISWLGLAVSFTATWIIATTLGIPIAWYEVAGTTVISYTVTLLPISLNGYGLREVTLTGLYGTLGATTAQAVTLALVTRFLMMSVTLPGALWVSEGVAVERQKARS